MVHTDTCSHTMTKSCIFIHTQTHTHTQRRSCDFAASQQGDVSCFGSAALFTTAPSQFDDKLVSLLA